MQDLRAVGIGRQDRVAMVAPNGPEAVVAFLALSASTSFVPLNPAYRAGEFDFYFTDLKPKALVVPSEMDTAAIDVARKHSIPIIKLSPIRESGTDLFSFQGERRPSASQDGFARAADIALILYTSGTISKPKKVPLTHDNLLSSAGNIVAGLGLSEKDRCLNVMPLFHIHGLVGAVLSSIVAGSSVVCSSGFDPEKFFTWLEEAHPTWYTAVPTIHQAVLSHAPVDRELLGNLSLRFIRSSSAPLPPRLMRELEDLFHVPVIEAYGMTEAAHQIASNPLPPGKRKAGSVGMAVATEIAVIDERGNYLSSGQSGEIVLRGSNIMGGYELGGPSNEEGFTHGWFRTGDEGYLDADGYLFISGRLKEQINRGGEKVSPYEVETVLLEHPAIAQAVVFPLPHTSLGEDVVAAVVLKPHRSISESELQKYTAVRLADFKVPRRVVFVEEIPTGPTGKVQRIGLAERLGLSIIAEGAIECKAEFVAPRNDIERKLAQIWTEALRIDPISIDDNFFELGGQSIMAAQIINRVRMAMKAELSFMTFFENPTVAKMASRIEDWTGHVRAAEPPATVSLSRPSEVLLSSAQQRLWFFDQMEPSSYAFNRPLAFSLSGLLNARVLEQCLNEIVRRHEILRTIFPVVDGQPRQVILPSPSVPFLVIDLSNLPANDREDEALELACDEVRRPFDLACAPLFRAALFRLDEQEHLLTLATHHIAADGWSDGILLREMTVLYEAFNNGDPSPLGELPIQYADYSQWQQSQLEQGTLDQDLSYWTTQLKDLPGPLDLPSDRTRPPVRTYRGRYHNVILPVGLTQSLKELSRREQATLFMTLLTAFKILLSRYTGGKDILVGVPVAGRNQIDTEHLIGVFINILVLRTDLFGNPSFHELLQRVRKTALEAQAHQDLPFERLVEALQPEHDLSYPPLFEVMFQLRNLPGYELALPGLTARAVELDIGTARLDLELEITEQRHSLECRFIYNTDLFDPATIGRMAGHFHNLLQNIVIDPHQRLSDLTILSDSENEQMLVEWNDTQRAYPNVLIHELFEAQVERSPEAVAVVFEDKQLTYRQLNEQSNQLAHYLRNLGVEPEVVVGICVERSLEMVVGLLGIHKAGGAYLPLDPQYPPNRLACMLQDTHTPVLLTQRRLIDVRRDNNPRLSISALSEVEGLDSKLKVVCLDSDWKVIARESEENPRANVSGDNLAYVIYTSGSTGKPKGVEVTHRALTNFTASTCASFALVPDDRVLQFASMSFDVAVEEIFPCLIRGSTLVLRTEAMLDSFFVFLQECRDQRITVLDLPTAYWHELTEKLTSEHLVLSETLRLVIIGGERAVPERLAQWHKAVGNHVRLLNCYGPTEATVEATTWESSGSAAADLPAREIPIGLPIANVRTYVLDRWSNPVPIGVPGELHIGGVGLARGYLNHPDLTAEKFIPDPFGCESGGRLYKTGDVARYLPSGNIEFLGRIDHQVKIRGFRIELGEIEATLSKHPGVRQSIVLVREDQPGEKLLVGYVVGPKDQALATVELRSFLKQKLPDYMAPLFFVFLDALPLTPNGKVDRKALPAPNHGRPELETAFVPPSSPVEKTLSDIWAEVLKIEQIGLYDNFFDLGGHSLLATRVISRLRDAFRVEMPLRLLFEQPTVAGLAERIDTLLWAGERYRPSVTDRSEEREEINL